MSSPWVLFDLDGTLTQSEEGIWNGVRHVAAEMGIPVPADSEMHKFIGPPLEYSFQHYLGMSPEDAERAKVIYRQRYTTVGMFENRVYPGIRGVLRALSGAGFRLGVVTGKPAYPTGQILKHFGLDKWMSAVVCATDGHAEKEHLIRQALPEDSGPAWMVGDRCFDMEGGRLAGIHTLGVTYGYGSEEELLESGAERIARSPREILEVLCPDTRMPKGAFISVEGLDGSGKGTQIERLTDLLDRYGFEVKHSREPGGSPIGEKIRAILLDRTNREMEPETEALLYAASRAQHVREVIRPAVADGYVLVCDRYVDSSAAYQGGGRGLGVGRVLEINAPAVDHTLPDATVYLRMDHRQALARRCAASVPDRMEMEKESFHARVEAAFDELANRDPDRFITVDAGGSVEEIAAQLGARVLTRLMEAED